MKTSEFIKALQYSLETYGDLPVSLSIAHAKGTQGISLDLATGVVSTEGDYTFGYQEMEDNKAELNIRDFPY